MRSKATRIRVAAVVAILMSGAVLPADTRISANLEVSAVVVPNCRLTLTPLDFGVYDPLGVNSTASQDASATMLITCTRNSRLSISMDEGRSPGGLSQRGLTFADQRLDYQIFRDAARTRVWRTGADALEVVSALGSTRAQQLIVYGRIPSGQDVAPGTYTDLVRATVDF